MTLTKRKQFLTPDACRRDVSKYLCVSERI